MNILQPWIIVAILVAAVNWKLLAKFLDAQFWPRLGWNDGDFRELEVRTPLGLLRWLLTGAIIFGLLALIKPSDYVSLAVLLIPASILNFLSYFIVAGIREWLKNAPSRYEQGPRYQGLQRILYVSYAVSYILLFIGMLFWQLIPANIAERAYIKSQTTAVKEAEDLSSKFVAVRGVNEIMRDGTTWFEIQAHWEPKVVYQVKEHPDHNSALKALLGKQHSPSRDSLLEIKWQNAKVGHTPSGNHVLQASVQPEVVILARVVTLE